MINENTFTISDCIPHSRMNMPIYRKIWSDLTKREQEILHAMSKGKTTLKEICAELSMSTSTYSKYRDLLKKKGVLVIPAQGEIAFALPRFGEVIKYYE